MQHTCRQRGRIAYRNKHLPTILRLNAQVRVATVAQIQQRLSNQGYRLYPARSNELIHNELARQFRRCPPSEKLLERSIGRTREIGKHCIPDIRRNGEFISLKKAHRTFTVFLWNIENGNMIVDIAGYGDHTTSVG